MKDMMYNEYRSKLRWWWENPNRAEILDGSPIHEGDMRLIDNDDLGDAYYRRALKYAYENYMEIKRYVKECLVENDSEQGSIEQDIIRHGDDVSTMPINIIRYSDLWQQTCVELLVKLQSRLVRLDIENVQVLTERYVSEYLKLVLEDIAENDGAAFLAIHDGKAIGLIAGSIEAKDEIDQLTTRCPKRGIIKELIINAEYRGQGIGQKLMKAMERFFENKGCEFVAVDVFAPNKLAIAFYRRNGYEPRNIEMYKRIQRSMQDMERE